MLAALVVLSLFALAGGLLLAARWLDRLADALEDEADRLAADLRGDDRWP